MLYKNKTHKIPSVYREEKIFLPTELSFCNVRQITYFGNEPGFENSLGIEVTNLVAFVQHYRAQV